MRALLAGTIAAAAFAFAAPAAAQTWYPWCAHYGGDDYGGAIACGFTSYAQCAASVSGVGGFCLQNALPPPPSVTPRPERRRSPR